MAARDNSQNDRSPGTLNVFLHGAFTLIPDDKQILALTPDLPDHVTCGGNFLAETKLRSASYCLDGVKAGSAHEFDREKNLVVKLDGEIAKKPAPYLRLKFPPAKKITSLRVAEIPTKFFSPRDALVVKGDNQHMATLQVLTYDIADENRLALRADEGEDHHWQPAFTGDHMSFHIFSSEDHYHKPSNAQLDFNKCVELLGLNLTLDARFLPARGIEDSDLPPYGVAPEETEVLALRTLRMARLGRLVVQKGDTNLAWHGNDALDGNPKSCGCVVACQKC